MHYCCVAHEANACRQFRVCSLLSILVQLITDAADTSSKELH